MNQREQRINPNGSELSTILKQGKCPECGCNKFHVEGSVMKCAKCNHEVKLEQQGS